MYSIVSSCLCRRKPHFVAFGLPRKPLYTRPTSRQLTCTVWSRYAFVKVNHHDSSPIIFRCRVLKKRNLLSHGAHPCMTDPPGTFVHRMSNGKLNAILTVYRSDH